MNAAGLFRVRVLRLLTIGTRRALPGAEISVDAETAATLVREGGAVLVDPNDIAVLAEVAPRPRGGTVQPRAR